MKDGSSGGVFPFRACTVRVPRPVHKQMGEKDAGGGKPCLDRRGTAAHEGGIPILLHETNQSLYERTRSGLWGDYSGDQRQKTGPASQRPASQVQALCGGGGKIKGKKAKG